MKKIFIVGISAIVIASMLVVFGLSMTSMAAENAMQEIFSESGIVYNNTGSPNMSDKTYQSPGSTMSGPCWINDLVIGKTYYIRAYVSNLTNGECVLNNDVVVYTHSVPDISVKANETVTLSATSAKCSAVLSYEEYYTANSVNVSSMAA